VRGARDRGLTREATPALFAALETATADAPVTYSLLPNDASTFTPPDWDLLVQRSAPGAVVLNSTSLQERLSRSIRDRSFATVVMTLFAFATTVITTAGLVGIVGYVVARRTHEIGIRLAIGARGGQVIWLVMRDAIAATATGAVLGTVIAAWLSHGLEALLYGVSAGNLTTLSVTTVGLIFFALIAAAIPARRAGRLSPTVALRAE
jgi:ABC-type antimicrobial peptide transport system permease subunit